MKKKCNAGWPLTIAQEQIAIEQGRRKESTSYNINLAIKIMGCFNVAKLETALNELINHEPI